MMYREGYWARSSSNFVLTSMMDKHSFDTSASPQDRRLVAVPDSAASKGQPAKLYRLGVQSTGKGAAFTPGETGPAGQRLPWIYLRAGNSVRYEIDLDNATLTIAIRDPKTGKSGIVVHKIDPALMEQAIVTGETVRIVFAYDHGRMVDETLEIDEWCATTGPRYTEELNARLGQLDNIVEEFDDDKENAKENGRWHEATRAPKSATPFRRSQERVTDEDPLYGPIDQRQADIEIDYTLPEGVQIFDPISGKTFVGRRWVRPHEETNLAALVNGGYRFAVVEFRNGDTATLMPNYSGQKMAIQIKTPKGMVSRILDESANFAPLGPGKRLDVEMISTLDGDRIVEGKMLTTPPIVIVVGVGPEAEREDLPYPHDTTLEKFRDDNVVQNTAGRQTNDFAPNFSKSA